MKVCEANVKTKEKEKKIVRTFAIHSKYIQEYYDVLTTNFPLFCPFFLSFCVESFSPSFTILFLYFPGSVRPLPRFPCLFAFFFFPLFTSSLFMFLFEFSYFVYITIISSRINFFFLKVLLLNLLPEKNLVLATRFPHNRHRFFDSCPSPSSRFPPFFVYIFYLFVPYLLYNLPSSFN
uniref:Uncharacterized protein TCIL3000_7_1970 n=1 Tax=Trypanosoma congolense (strain IL3000) TaxID=1068625 RepID=G0UPS6_TRYCI|nr:unnamed protein product [Trypanosoma congolense IL3000]